jgi:hypothetical protein
MAPSTYICVYMNVNIQRQTPLHMHIYIYICVCAYTAPEIPKEPSQAPLPQGACEGAEGTTTRSRESVPTRLGPKGMYVYYT